MGGQQELKGPDLSLGIPAGDLADGAMLLGHANGDAVLLARRGEEIFAIGATCTHYGGPLAEGLVVGDEVRCPWHHACFDLRTGAALKAPAFASLPAWRVETIGDTVYVREPIHAHAGIPTPTTRTQPERIVVLGGGAAGFAAADRLRRLGSIGTITISASKRSTMKSAAFASRPW